MLGSTNWPFPSRVIGNDQSAGGSSQRSMDRIRSEACTVLAKFNRRALLNIAGFLPFLSLPGLSKSSGWLPNSVFKAHLHFLRFDGFYWVLLGFIRFYWVSLGFIRFHWYLLGFTGFFWALLSITGFLLSFTRF